MIRQNVEDMKLAHEEEVAAMDELRRVTSKSPAFDNNIRDDNQAAIERQAETESRNKSSGSVSSGNRQSRLQRTCQNQNFDIFENQYPELSGQQAHEASFHKRKSPHLKQPQPYMNLFRESPDFTLTINTANQYYQPMEEADYARKSEDKLDGMKIEYTEMDEALAAISHEPVSTNDHCKVMDLDRDFRFLGSLSGHKYFVERTGE